MIRSGAYFEIKLCEYTHTSGNAACALRTRRRRRSKKHVLIDDELQYLLARIGNGVPGIFLDSQQHDRRASLFATLRQI
jgi:type VI protein secretion system component VasK